jgi:hypothetical protein
MPQIPAHAHMAIMLIDLMFDRNPASYIVNMVNKFGEVLLNNKNCYSVVVGPSWPYHL